MLIDQSLDWWRANSGQVVSFDRLQPYSVFLQCPTGDQATPRPVLIGASTIQARELGDTNPESYSDLLAGPWRPYAIGAMDKLRRISETRTPEFGCSIFPGGLWGDPFHYEWVTLPCRIGNRPLIITLSRQVTLH